MPYTPRRLRPRKRPVYTVKVDNYRVTEAEAAEIRRKVRDGLKNGVFVHGPHISVRKL
jgi:hypothetical protein